MKQLYYSFIYPYLTYAITSLNSKINAFVQFFFFLHTVERMLRLTIIYWISSNLITFSNLK